MHGKVHNHLGMKFDFSEHGKVKLDMTKHVADAVEDSSLKLKKSDMALTPAAKDLFAESEGNELK